VDGTYGVGRERGTITDGLTVDRVLYDKGIFAHGPSRVLFDIAGAYQAVSGCAGIATMADCGVAGAGGPRHENGDVTFSIEADGVEVWNQYGAAGQHSCFALPTTGVRQLTFIAATAGSHSCDAAAWTDLKVCTSETKDGAGVHACDQSSVMGAVGDIHEVCCRDDRCAEEYPDQCSQACADAFLPFFEGCEATLDATTAAAMQPLFELCVDRPDVPATRLDSCSYLGSDIAAAQTHVGYGEYMVDGTPADEGGYQYHEGLTIGGVAYEKGIFAHAASSVTFTRLEEWATVSGCAGLADFAGCGKDAEHGQVTFSIEADGRTIWTKSMNGGTADGITNCFSLHLVGVQQLRFLASSDGTQNCDSAAWGDLRVCHESDDSCAFDAVLPAAIACADTNIEELLSPRAAQSFCSSSCARASRELSASCLSSLPAGLEDLAPVMELLSSEAVPRGCGSGDGGNSPGTTDGDISRECQASLSTFSSMFLRNCCVGGDCDSDAAPGVDVSVGFIPQTCTERCASSFVPFFSECGEAVWADQPERLAAMRDLARICTHETTAGGTDDGCVFLGSDVPASEINVGPMPYGVDGMWMDAPGMDPTTRGPGWVRPDPTLVFDDSGLLIGDTRYARGIFTHAPARVVFEVDPSWTTVSGCSGFAKMCGEVSWCHCDADCANAQIQNDWGDVTYRISAGDQTLWSHSATVRSGRNHSHSPPPPSYASESVYRCSPRETMEFRAGSLTSVTKTTTSWCSPWTPTGAVALMWLPGAVSKHGKERSLF
jgi:hypothetical protein